MADVTFTVNFKKVAENTLDLNSGTFKALLLVSEGSTYTANGNTDQYVVTAAVDECSVAGYARDTLTFSVVTSVSGAVVDNGSGTLSWRSDPITFTGMNSGETANRVVIYKENTSDGDSPMLCCLDIDPTSTGADITINEPTSPVAGWFRF